MIATAAVGVVVLGVSLRIEPGSDWFYPATLVLAAVWAGGALLSGPLRVGRPSWTPVLVGLGLSGLFVVGALLVRLVPPLQEQVASVMDIADQGSLPLLVVVTVVNGVAEELFFRGAAYAALPARPVLWTTVGYTLATLATGNVMLGFAAVLLGLVTGLQRAATGTLMAPILTHLCWSVPMLLVLPLLF